jgi:hypothetical protein
MAKAALTGLLALALAACSTGGGLFGGNPSATDASAVPPRANPSPANDGVLVYLQTMRDLIEGDPVVQADVFRNSEAAALFEPTTTNRLNYALALATPGHPSANAGEAQRLLAEVLAAGDSLLPEERILAVVHLKEVEQRLILDAQAQRLQQAAADATNEQNNQTAERLRTALEENRRLRVELDQAREKLDAITNIERSIRERENGADPQ